MIFQAHPWFKGIQWDMLYESEAAYKPTVTGDLDTQNFEKFPEVSLCIYSYASEMSEINYATISHALKSCNYQTFDECK